MKIEEIRQDKIKTENAILQNLDNVSNNTGVIFLDAMSVMDNQQEYINQLEADKLEAYKWIAIPNYDRKGKDIYDIINKAQKYLGERSERD